MSDSTTRLARPFFPQNGGFDSSPPSPRQVVTAGAKMSLNESNISTSYDQTTGTELGFDDYDEKRGTAADRADMWRLGRVQELRRSFRFPSIFGFTVILMASWEIALEVAGLAFINGGRAGSVWLFLACWIGYIFVNCSMAEMSSMVSTIGGQYHWVSEFAPKSCQKLLSYLVGWMCVLGWQAGCAGATYVTGTTIQALVVMNRPEYEFQRWQGTLYTIAVAAFSAVFNTLLARKLPIMEAIVLVIHVCAFIGILVALWVLAPVADARAVFADFSDVGWGSVGASTLASITAVIAPLLGADSAAHMAEEVQDASQTIPKSIVWSTIINGAMGWVTVITLCFCIQDADTEDVLSRPTGYPFIKTFQNVAGHAEGTVMVAIIVSLGLMSSVANATASSRQLFAFSRDQAVPFSSSISTVAKDLPVNAILVTFLCTSLLSLVNLGSVKALDSMLSLSAGALMSSYITSIGCILWRRLSGQSLPTAKFSLGRFGLFVNVTAEIFLLGTAIFAFFPAVPHPSIYKLDWGIVMYGIVIMLSLVYYFFRGRHQYVAPVDYVRKMD